MMSNKLLGLGLGPNYTLDTFPSISGWQAHWAVFVAGLSVVYGNTMPRQPWGIGIHKHNIDGLVPLKCTQIHF